MSEGSGSLRRYQEVNLPPGFHLLNPEQQILVVQKMMDDNLEIRKMMQDRIGKSHIAEHDLRVALDAIVNLDHDRKMYSYQATGETGSGKYNLTVRGGDVQFMKGVSWVVIAFVIALLVVVSLASR